MKKLYKTIIVTILSVMSALFMLTACNGNSSGAAEIIVEGQDYTVEVNEIIKVPAAWLADKNGETVEGEVEVSVVNPKNVVVATSVMDIQAKILGEYRITYSYEGVEDVVIKVLSQDSRGPVLTLDDTFANMYKGQSVLLPNINIDDFSEIDNDSAVFKVYYLNGETREEKSINKLANSFVADEAGNYIYHAEVSDILGNRTECEWPLYVTDKTWEDTDATGADIATFGSPDYINVFGAGTATDRQGNPDFEILEEYEGERGVAKVSMNYFDHNFGNYSSFNLRFPREYRYEEGKRLALRVRAEELNCDGGRLNLIPYEHTHVTGVGVSIISSYGLKAGEWTTLILENGILNSLKDSEGMIRGIQLDVKQSAEFPSSAAQTIYIASITEIETLSAPLNLHIEGTNLTWDEVANAAGYILSVNGEENFVKENSVALPQGAYTAKVLAVGDGIYYENSVFGAEFGNVLKTPEGLKFDENGILSWEPVENASGYIVDINGTEHTVNGVTEYEFTGSKDKNYLIKVKAKGEGAWYDSGYSALVLRYISQPAGYIADFSDSYFVYDVLAVNVPNLADMAAESFEAEYLESYEGANGVLKINMTANGTANGWAVVSLKLPASLVIDETLDSISIKFRLEGIPGGEYAGLRVYGYGADGQGRELSPAETYGYNGINEWFTAVIARDKILAGFNNAAKSDYILFGIANVPAYTQFSLYLDEITCERLIKLSVPQNLVLSGSVLSWDAVPGASGYIVSVNGEETEVSSNSLELSAAGGAYTIRVKAVGVEGYIASEFSESITNVMPVPGGLRYENGMITWNAVDGAEKYILNINGEEITVNGALNYSFTPAADSNYVIKIKTATQGAWFESDYDKGIAIRGKAQPEGYIADFSDGTFVYDVLPVNAENLIGNTAAEYHAQYLESYEGANGVLKTVMTTNNGSPNWAMISLKLPSLLIIDETLKSLSIKFRVEGIPGDPYAGLRIYGYGADGQGRDLSPAGIGYDNVGVNEWYTAVFDRATVLSGFNNAQSSGYILFGVANAPLNTTFSLYLDEITCEREEPVSTAENYLAEFADNSCETLVENVNVINLAEMAAASYSAEYLEEYQGAEGVLKINMTIAANGWAVISLKLPEPLIIDSALDSVKIKFRLEGMAGGIYAGLRIYGYGGDAQGRDLSPAETYAENGIEEWYTAVIAKDKIDAGFNNAQSSEYILFGVANVPAGTSVNIYLDFIATVTE